jgi:hypothetical protein
MHKLALPCSRLNSGVTDNRSVRSPLELKKEIESFRAKLERVFHADTANRLVGGAHPASSGHCCAVAVILWDALGGELVSASVNDASHWFNRITLGDVCYDFDITGDQFGRPSVQMADSGHLYAGTRLRDLREVDKPTRARTEVLAKRACVLQQSRNAAA